MGAGDFVTLAQGGPFLALLAFVVWDKTQERKAARDREAADRELAKERVETDKALASSMTLLSARIEGLQ